MNYTKIGTHRCTIRFCRSIDRGHKNPREKVIATGSNGLAGHRGQCYQIRPGDRSGARVSRKFSAPLFLLFLHTTSTLIHTQYLYSPDVGVDHTDRCEVVSTIHRLRDSRFAKVQVYIYTTSFIYSHLSRAVFALIWRLPLLSLSAAVG